jgi:flagellar biosynthesis chaperone FliJ
MADLTVDTGLDDVNTALKSISDEFDNAQSNADAGDSVWGQRDVAQAMHDFAHNWYVHRDKIKDRLAKLSTRVDEAVQTWTDADHQLGASIATQSSDSGGGAAAAAQSATGTETTGATGG